MFSHLNLDPIDLLILNGFLRTLTVLESPLSEEAIADINQLGLALKNNQLKSLRQLEQIAHRYPILKDKYDSICRELQAEYKPQELVRPRKRDDEDIQLQRILENTVLTTLTDPDPKSTAKAKKDEIDKIENLILPPV